jgi:hypothetical protein
VRTWTLAVAGASARVREGLGTTPALVLRMPLATFARAAAGELSPAELGMSSEIAADGDLGVLQRLGEMLGATGPY